MSDGPQAPRGILATFALNRQGLESMHFHDVNDAQPALPRLKVASRQAQGEWLGGEIAALLGGSGNVSDMLHQCCRLLVERLGVAFARIWTLAPEEQVLKLEASAGHYTRLDGSHSRVPVGQYKIGLIARNRRPHLTNGVLGDELVHDQEWAQREGMTAFAGYPLLADGEVVGVLAMFSRQAIAAEDFASLEVIAGVIANYVRRKQSEQALLESEARFRRLAEGIGVIPWEADARSWRFTYVGPQAAKILAYPVEAWYAPDFWVAHIHPEDREAAVEICRQRTERGEDHYQFEYRMLRADGGILWFLDIVNVISDERGPKTLQGFLIDITERKRAEQAVQESQQRLQLIADALPVLISYIDAQVRFQFNNAAYEQWFGIPRQELRGRPLHEILGEAAYQIIREHVEAALVGEARSFEGRIPYHGVGTRDVHVDYIPHRTADGKVAGFFALIIDMTARKQAEEALRDREARLSAILNTAVDAIITINQEGVIESVNPAAEGLFGYSAAELLGQNVNLLMPAPHGQEYLASYLKSGVKHTIGRGRELTARRKDGSLFPIELSVSEVQDGRIWFTGIVHDLSRRKALEREVLEVSAQEQQRIAQELHDGVGQELTGLGLMANALARRLPETCPAEQKLAGKLVEGLDRVHQQMRTLCRGLILTGFDPDALRMALEELAASTSEQTGVACTLECPETIRIPDSLTAKHLYRIVQEAVSNALRHGRPQHIWLSLRSTPEGLRVSVRDDGVGVAEQPAGEQGMGIPTMRYRAGMIGGILQIGPADTGGTLVTCTLSGRKYVGQ